MGNLRQRVLLKECRMGVESREDIKRTIEGNGLVCDCGQKVYVPGSGTIETQPNYNKYFDYLECPRCRKTYFL